MNDILMIVTTVVTYIFGIIAKKNPKYNNALIPLQNIAIGVIVATIEWLVTKNFKLALSASGLFACGVYDLFDNLKKLVGGNNEPSDISD